MIEESAIVVEVTDEGSVLIETRRESACGGCAANRGCGTAVLAKVLGNRRAHIKALSAMPLKVGDRVVIGIDESALVRGSMAVYALPLLLMVGFAVLGELLAHRLLLSAPDAFVSLSGIAGLMAGFYWVKRFARSTRSSRRFQPVVLRRDENLQVVSGPKLVL